MPKETKDNVLTLTPRDEATAEKAKEVLLQNLDMVKKKIVSGEIDSLSIIYVNSRAGGEFGVGWMGPLAPEMWMYYTERSKELLLKELAIGEVHGD